MDLKDSDWILKKCEEFDEPFILRSWLLTARSLFPDNFLIQYEMYNLMKKKGKQNEVSKMFQEMVQSFPQEPLLWEEVNLMCSSLNNPNNEEKKSFMQNIFQSLKSELRISLLGKVVSCLSLEASLQHLNLLLYLSQHFPDSLVLIEMIDKLFEAEKKISENIPNNQFRKLLTSEVLIRLVHNPHVSFSSLFSWIVESFYYLISIFSHKNSFNQSDIRLEIEKNGKESLCLMERICRLVCQRMQWTDEIILFDQSRTLSDKLNILNNLPNVIVPSNLEEGEWDGGAETEIFKRFLPTLTLFLSSLHFYALNVQPHSSNSMNSSQVHLQTEYPSYCLMERSIFNQMMTTPKNEKLNENFESQILMEHFVLASTCFSILNSQPLSQKFSKLMSDWSLGNWIPFQMFQLDVFLYLGDFNKLLLRIVLLEKSSLHINKHRSSLQKALAFFKTSQFQHLFEVLLDLSSHLPQENPQFSRNHHFKNENDVLFEFVLLNKQNVLCIIIQLIMATYWKVWNFSATFPNLDVVLGNCLVLSQFAWPFHSSIVRVVLDQISKRGHFSYEIFSKYVTNIQIIEELLFMHNNQIHLSLQVVSCSQKSSLPTRTVTRGVNKFTREDVKNAIIRQVKLCGENAGILVLRFLEEEKETLLLPLSFLSEVPHS